MCRAKSVTDHELLRQYASTGSSEAFDSLVERHSALVYSVCYRVLLDRQWAEDATQAVFLILMKKPCVSPDFNLPGWLHGCAVRIALKIKRVQYRRALRERGRMAPMASPSDESARLLWNEIKPHVDSALAALPALQRDAIVLRYLNGLTELQAAKSVGCSQATLHSRVRLGLARLRERLKRNGLTASASSLQLALTLAPTEQVSATLTESIKYICTGNGTPSSAVSELARTVKTSISAKFVCGSLFLLGACAFTILAFRNPSISRGIATNSPQLNADYSMSNKTVWSFEKVHTQEVPVTLHGKAAIACRITPDQLNVPGKAVAHFDSLPANFRLEYDFQIETGRGEIICFAQGMGVYVKDAKIVKPEYEKGVWYHWTMEIQHDSNSTNFPAHQVVRYTLDGKLMVKGEVEKYVRTVTLDFDTASVLIANFSITDLGKSPDSNSEHR